MKSLTLLLLVATLAVGAFGCPEGCLCQDGNICTICDDGYVNLNIDQHYPLRCAPCGEACQMCEIRLEDAAADSITYWTAVYTALGSSSTDPTTIGLPASVDFEAIDEMEYKLWLKLYAIAKTAEKINNDVPLTNPQLQTLFELYPIMMENLDSMNLEEIRLEPSKITVRLNQMTSSSFDRNQAMSKIGMTVKSYSTCEHCGPLYVPTPDADIPENWVCQSDPYCTMEGCLACEGTVDLWLSELEGTFTAQMQMQQAICVDCGPGKFSDGKFCFDCPPGCMSCDIDMEMIGMEIPRKWESELQVLSAGSQDPSALPSLELNFETYSQIRSWILITALAEFAETYDITLGSNPQTYVQIPLLFNSLLAMNDPADQISAIVAAINSIQNDLVLTPELVLPLYGQYLSGFTICSECAEGLFKLSNGKCSQCPSGKFNTNANPDTAPICQSCPAKCEYCFQEQGVVVCDSCLQGYGFNEQGICEVCPTNCQKCYQSSVCDKCKLNYMNVWSETAQDFSCVEDTYCLSGCAVCSGSNEVYEAEEAQNPFSPQQIQDLVMCEECLPGKFNTGTVCYNCPAGCSQCHLDEDEIWAYISEFWEQALQEVIDQLTIAQQDTSIVPVFDPQTESLSERVLWLQLYLMMDYILQQAPMITRAQLGTAMIGAHSMMSITYGHEEKMAAAATFLSSFSEEPLTAEDVEKGYAFALGKFATCEQCKQGYSFNIYDECQACPSGQYDRNALTTNAPRCAACSIEGCGKCGFGGNGQLECFECMDGWQQDVDGSCFQCDPKCISCQFSPEYCYECVPPYLLLTDEGLGISKCVEDVLCGQNCLQCSGSSQYYIDLANGVQTTIQEAAVGVTCDLCPQGSYAYGVFCYRCPLGCDQCTLDTATLWSQVGSYWNTTLQTVINTIGANGVPTVDPATNDDAQQKMWILLKALYDYLDENTQMSQYQILALTYPLPAQLSEVLPTLTVQMFTEMINGITGSSLTSNDGLILLGEALADYTSCDQCFRGFTLDTGACIACPITGEFNANRNQSGTPDCRPCPGDCAECEAGADGRPFCVDCGAVNLDADEGICFECDPKCDTGCGESPDDCNDCISPYVLEVDPNNPDITRCVRDELCDIDGCVECTGMNLLTEQQKNNEEIVYMRVFCNQCSAGLYSTGKECKVCPFGAVTCSLDTAALRTDVQGFWVPGLAGVVTMLEDLGQDTSGVPSFVGSDLSEFEWVAWTNFYFVVQYMIVLDNGAHSEAQVILAAEPLYRHLIENPQSLNDFKGITQFLNSFGGPIINQNILRLKYNAALQQYVFANGCISGFYLNADDDCTRCTHRECTVCDGTDACTDCIDGYWLDGNVCTRCDGSCKTCSAAGNLACTSCTLPLTLSGNQCVRCDPQCRTCDSSDSSFCLTCKKPYSLEANDNGECFMCDDVRCLQCDSADQSVCQTCQQGLVLVDGVCQQCPEFCVDCSLGTENVPAICFECQEGYVEVDGHCVPCSRGCKACTKQNGQLVCEECYPGKFLSLEEQKCEDCQFGCDECHEGGCAEFKEGFVEYLGIGVIECDPGCKTCDPSNPRQCLECKNGFVFDDVNLVCINCPAGCKQCTYDSGTGVKTCSACRKGFYNTGSACARCGNGCAQCSDTTGVCTDCKRGYNPTADPAVCEKDCQQRGCAECDESDNTICYEAKAGFALTLDNTVVKCARKCSGSCDPQDITSCTSCADGFMMVENTCKKCLKGELTCTEAGPTSCIEGYRLKTTTVRGVDYSECKKQCIAPCIQCDQDYCTDCSYGFKDQNGVCVFDEEEVCDDSGVCEFCPINYFLNGVSACEQCSTAECTTCPGDTCTMCREGFYLDTATCEPCSAECQTCYDADTCQTCADGYFKEPESFTDGVADAVFSDFCAACDPNCKTCFLEAFRCQSCEEGYHLKNNRCEGKYAANIKMKLDIDFAYFKENRMAEQFLELMANFLQIDIDRVNIISLQEGSVDVETQIDDSTQSGASAVASSFDADAMAASSTGSAFPVTSSSVGVYYDDEPLNNDEEEEEEQGEVSNVGMIVGIVVGVIAIVAIVGFVVFKVCTNKRDVQQQKVNDQQSQMIIMPASQNQKASYA